MQVIKRVGPLINTQAFRDIKDPCPVFDGNLWHIYGSGGTIISEKWKIYHATSLSLDGPWEEQEPALVKLDNPHVAAPGVIYDFKEKLFHMFVQTDFLALGGTIEHLISSDGHRFNNFGSVIKAEIGTEEACVYDPHPALINNEYYITYSGAPAVGKPDIYLAKSMGKTWYGPWMKLGKILTHKEVPHHNQHDHPDYEWGLEGSQLIELPNKKILLNAVCFLPTGEYGTRQRVFFAIADSVRGPYKTLGPALEPEMDSWGKAENGHAAGFIVNNKLELLYQARSLNMPWRYGRATFDISSLSSTL